MKSSIRILSIVALAILGLVLAIAPVQAQSDSTLTVDLDGPWIAGVTVELWNSERTTKLWGLTNQHGAEQSYTVAAGTYDLKLVNAPHELWFDNLDCNSNCNPGTVKQTLTVDLTGTWNAGVTVELYADDAGKIWGVTNQHGAVLTYNVLNGVYDLKLVQGPHSLSVDVDCTEEACNAGTVKQTLTVDLDGVWNAGVTVELYADDAGKIWGVTNQHGAVRTYNVLNGVYDLKILQGPKVKDVADINCDGVACSTGDVVSQLALNLAPNTGVTAKLHLNDDASCTAGSQIWSVNNQSGTPVYNVLKNTYDVSLVIAGKTYVWDAVSCTGESCTLNNSTLTVNFPGINSVHTYVYNSNGVAGTVSGAVIASQTHKNDQAIFTNLPNGTYDVRIVQGGMVKIVDDVFVMGNCVSVDNIVSTMTVEFPGINTVHTYVKTNDNIAGSFTGGDVASSTHKNNSTEIKVLKGVYDVKVVQGSQENIYDSLDCTGDTCSISDIVSTMTVSFPGINTAHTYVKTNDNITDSFTGGDVASSTHKNDGTTITVLKGVYDVRVVQGAQGYIRDALDCTGDTCSINDIVSTMTVNFPGINTAHTYVKTNDNIAGSFTGGDVASSTHKNNSTEIKVLKGVYDVRVVQGAQGYIRDALDCTGDTCSISGIVSTMTVNFPGLNTVHTYVKTNDGIVDSFTGGDVASSTHKNNSTTIIVLKAFYDVRIVHGAQSYLYDAVDCTGDTCTLDKSSLTVNFPGINGLHLYLYQSNNVAGTVSGSVKAQQTYKNDQAVFANLSNGKYDLRLVQGGMTMIIDDIVVLGNFATVNNIVATLTVNFPGINGVHTYVRTTPGLSSVTQTTYKENTTSMVVLKGNYDVRVVQGGQNNTYVVDCSSGTCTIENIVETLTVNFPGINGVHTYVRTTPGLSSVTQTTYKNDTTSMVVLEGNYDVRVVQGGQNNTYAVDCTSSGSCLIEDIVETLTVNFPGINGVHTYVRTTPGLSSVTQTTYKNDTTLMVVLEGNYNVRVVQGGQNNTYAVDCTDSGSCLIEDIVKTLTVNFPGINGAHTYVKTNDGVNGAFDGGSVAQTTYKNDGTTIVLLEGTYDVKVVQGSQQNVYDEIDCTDSGPCLIEDIVATMTVNFPGFNGVHTYVKTNDGNPGTAGGGSVTQVTYKNGSAILTVLRGFYDVRVVKGASEDIHDAVDCSGATCVAPNENVETITPPSEE